MGRPPRSPDQPVIDRRTVWTAILQGVWALAIVLSSLIFAIRSGYGEDRARTVAFSSLILINVGLIFTNRAATRGLFGALRVRNRALAVVVGSALLLLLLSFTWEPMQAALRFAPPSIFDLLTIAGAGLLGVAGFDALKARRR